MTLPESQKIIDEWIKTHGVRYFNELTNMALLTEEVGELARIELTPRLFPSARCSGRKMTIFLADETRGSVERVEARREGVRIGWGGDDRRKK